MTRIFLYILIMAPYGLFSQKVLTRDQLKEDFLIFESVLKTGHPTLYEYTSKTVIDSLFNDTKKKLAENTTDIELYKKMVSLTNQVKDGNLELFAPEIFEISDNYFPILIKIIANQIYTDIDDFGIPIGSKILAIHNTPAPKIINDLLKYAPTDGYNMTRKYRTIESKFGLYYAYEYGIHKEYVLTVETPDDELKTITIPAESFAAVKERSRKRNSYFAKFHSKENDNTFFSERIRAKIPFVYFNEESNTAILTINSFGANITSFETELFSIFKEIDKKKIKYLIIDIRQNGEGQRANAIHLFSYVSKSPFKQRISTYISFNRIPQSKFVNRTYLNGREHLTEKYKDHVTVDGWELKFDDLESIMIPFKERFQGKVYVLTSGTTFSAGAVFAQLAKNDPDIVLIGEETGSGYYTNTGDFPVRYELPHSKIKLDISLVKIKNYVLDKTVPKGTGILPDRKIYFNREDLIEGRDPCLDYVFRLIDGQ